MNLMQKRWSYLWLVLEWAKHELNRRKADVDFVVFLILIVSCEFCFQDSTLHFVVIDALPVCRKFLQYYE